MKPRSLSLSMRVSIDSIKSELGKGNVVTRDRQQGKTTALLEFVHEHNPGNIIIVVPNWRMEELTKRRYRELFPQDPRPSVRSLGVVTDIDVRGSNREWVTDEIWPDVVKRKAESYAYVNYLGGVGTPMCMNLHSH